MVGRAIEFQGIRPSVVSAVDRRRRDQDIPTIGAGIDFRRKAGGRVLPILPARLTENQMPTAPRRQGQGTGSTRQLFFEFPVVGPGIFRRINVDDRQTLGGNRNVRLGIVRPPLFNLVMIGRGVMESMPGEGFSTRKAQMPRRPRDLSIVASTK